MVVAYHVIQMSPVSLPNLMRVARFGQYGVDLFFVLSGWLIGSLYWREYRFFGNVKLIRFWSRRWLRTVPPYWVALLLAWLAVFVERHEPFDWGYLAFIQNYYRQIPFFLVSWSLCIEEHFYLFLPLLLLFVTRSKCSMAILFTALIVMAPVGRWWESFNVLNSDFGFEKTATHLRMEGLVLGFGVAYLANFKPAVWHKIKKHSLWFSFISFMSFIICSWLGWVWVYRLGFSALASGFCGLLIYLIGRKPIALASTSIIKRTALSSYSVYLTHSLMIHVARKLVTALPTLPWLAYFPIVLVLISVAGSMFYYAVERTSINYRDVWVPRRKQVAIVNL